jgi:hypothetical protein
MHMSFRQPWLKDHETAGVQFGNEMKHKRVYKFHTKYALNVNN